MTYLYKPEHLTKENEQNASLTAHFFMGFDNVLDQPATFVKPILSFLERSENLFFRPEYFKILEKTPPKGVQLGYLFLKKNEQIVGFAPCQIKDFRAAESMNFSDECNLSSVCRLFVANNLNFQTLVIGNLSLTGENAFLFDNQLVTKKEEGVLLHLGIQKAKEVLFKRHILIKTVFLKDFYTTQNALDTEGYNRFEVEPNFEMNLPTDWQNFEDYLAALSSKYRMRAKRAFKKLGAIKSLDFDAVLVETHAQTIHDLYRQIAEKSDFNLVDLPVGYFPELKKSLGEAFILRGYFLGNKLVGFCSAIKNGDVLEAHFLGYDEELNAEHQLYLNMLFDLVRMGLDAKTRLINFGRTAHEIKSSIGAEARDMFLYLKHENFLLNRVLLYALPLLSPKEKWQPRSPFKL